MNNECSHISEDKQAFEDCQLEDEYNDIEAVNLSVYHEKKVIRENKILYKQLRKDFNPFIACLIGIIVGAILGVFFNKLMFGESTIAICSIFGGFIGVILARKKVNNDDY